MCVCWGGGEGQVSGKLSGKLGRQLEEGLSVAAGAVPPWCRRLPAACPWLFHLPARQVRTVARARALLRFSAARSANSRCRIGARASAV